MFLPARLRCVLSLLLSLAACGLTAAPTHLVDEAPVTITVVAPGVHLVDFGRVAFGNVRLQPTAPVNAALTLHFGEAFAQGRVNRQPPGTVRYATAKVTLAGAQPVVAAPPADVRNTQQAGVNDLKQPAMQKLVAPPPPAVLTPAAWGVVLPFRWVEIEGWPGELRPQDLVRQSAYASTWDDNAAAFRSSDERLNRIWELCRYSIKATTFAGVYVDGDRERIPYEADAYLNQISHYATDHDIQMARDTYDHLMIHGTWPTEWAPHMVFMAYADWRHTGDTAWLAPRYEALKAKLLLERAGPDGLIQSNAQQVKRTDIVDWPQAERDGYVFTPVNTVVNAFHLRALACMIELAGALGHTADVAAYTAREQATRAAFQEKLFDSARGLYRDGVGTDHTSLHANLFPLAFGLVPEPRRAAVTAWLVSRGMACSVYAAQYLLEGLFENEAATDALALITAPGDRSWRHMVESGTTITWEAWDQKYKPNQDWNHAWGAAPANLLPAYVLGVRPATAGWSEILLRPSPGSLTRAEGKVPTPRGPVLVQWEQQGPAFTLKVSLPEGCRARVALPAAAGSTGVYLNQKPVAATRQGARWILAEPISGQATLQLK